MSRGVREMVQDALKTVDTISAEAAKAQIDEGTASLVVDVREPNEFDQGHLPGAINVPRGLLELRADASSPVADPGLTASREARIVVYCLKAPGARSVLAAETLGRMGYSNVVAMQGGLEEWRAAGLDVAG
ncbi:MAG TPA: rhodanese-like domain-containing protein [Thermoleophilaceae bacterium]